MPPSCGAVFIQKLCNVAEDCSGEAAFSGTKIRKEDYTPPINVYRGKVQELATVETRQQREEREEREAFESRIAKALGHPLRVRIMELLNEGDASPADIARKLGMNASNLSYHFNILAELDCIELVEKLPVRGTLKNIYRSKQRAMFADLAWAALSPELRSEISRTMIENTLRRLGDAFKESTFDRKDDRHLSLQTVSVDWEGWDELTILMAETMHKVNDIEFRAKARATEANRFPATITLLSYESPRIYETPLD